MGRSFEHVIMTRFNLATPGKESSIRNRPGWLDGRFDLFEKYCLPSIAAQTSTRFQWIIYFDEGTPSIFRSRIEALRKVFPFIPYYTGLFPASGWPKSIVETFNFKPDALLSTRLDNDDALASDFVERLHDAIFVHAVADGAYNFENGFIMSNGKLYRLSHPNNAFFSFVAPYGEQMVTAPSIQHMELARHGKINQIYGSGGWMQIVHGGNVSNKIRGSRISPKELSSYFPETVLKELMPASQIALLFDKTFSGSLRHVRDTALFLKRILKRI